MKINGISISGSTGATGSAGTPAGLRYNVTSDPYGSLSGAGTANFNWAFDEGNPSYIDGIYINNTDLLGTNVTNQIAIAGQSTSARKGYIIIKSDDGTTLRVFTVTAAAQLTPPGYTFFAGNLDDPYVTFASTPCTLQFIRNGDKGDIGSTGSALKIQSTNQATFSTTITSTLMTATISSAGSYNFSGVMLILGTGQTKMGVTAPASTGFFQLCAQGLSNGNFRQQKTSTSGILLQQGQENGTQIFFQGFFECSGSGEFAVGYAAFGGQATCAEGSYCTIQKIA